MARKHLMPVFAAALALSAAVLAVAQPLGVVAPEAGTRPPVVIQLQPASKVYAPQIEVGEIAAVDGDRTDLIEKVRALDLGRAPWPGYSRAIEKSDVVRVLELAQIAAEDVVVQGPDVVYVETLNRTIPGEKLVSIAQDHILKQMSWNPDDVILEFTRFPRSLTVPDGNNVDFAVTMAAASSSLIGEVQLNIGIKVDDKIYQTVPVNIRVRLFRNVLVSRERLPRHTRLNSSNVALMRREVTNLSGNLLTDFDSASRLRTRMVVSNNTVLRDNMVEDVPAVMKGDEVQVRYLADGLQINLKGIARENGRIGDRISVQNAVTKKSFTATVEDESTVVIKQ